MGTILQYVTIYAPWQEHEDEPRKIDEWTVEHAVDDAEDAIRTLLDNGATEYSSHPDWQRNGWYSSETYTHPYSGEMESSTFHLNGFTETDSRRIHSIVNA